MEYQYRQSGYRLDRDRAYLRQWLRVEVARAQASLAVAGLDETLALPVERGGLALPRDGTGDVLCDDLGLAMGETPAFGSGLPSLSGMLTTSPSA